MGIGQKSDNRVLRGGSWINNGRNVRSANRNMNEPDNRNNNIGFRLALAHKMPDGKKMTRPLSRLRICYCPQQRKLQPQHASSRMRKLAEDFLHNKKEKKSKF